MWWLNGDSGVFLLVRGKSQSDLLVVFLYRDFVAYLHNWYTSMASSQTLNDQANFTRLSRLLVDQGTQALRKTLQLRLTLLPSTLSAALNTHKATLQKLRYKVINSSQWALLYPTSGPPDLQNFDVTLLTVLLRNICGLTSPATGWGTLPPDSDPSIAANIARIKCYRNEVYAHVTITEIADKDFENLWQKISTALIALGISKSELDELKETPLTPDEDVYVEQLKEWRKKDEELTEICLEINADVKKLEATVAKLQQELEQKYPDRENVSDVDNLGNCDFTATIKQLSNKFLPGTRQWLFDKLNSWFTDKHSDSTVMIVTAGPGVGKSVFSAKVCRMYAELELLAACHFCQYNKSDYRNPLIIIQSLASHMCLNVKGFKEKLENQLKRSHSRETITDSFRVLINDPLFALEEREPMLLVIDALDESEFKGKSEFLELISDEFPNLPKWIKILVTSRPELPVQEKLKHLNPIHVAFYETQNIEDLQKYLRTSLPFVCDDDHVFESLAWRCQGSFLYAYYTQLELKQRKTQLTRENIFELVPKGIGDFYQKQFKHLKNQLNKLGPTEVTLKRFLVVLVAAGPLPLSLLPECLGLPDDAEYELREKINEIMSSILPVFDDCLTIYHKSLRDWLTSDGYKEHAFTVDSQSGHEYLWRACEKVFDQINSATTLPNLKSPLIRYALAHGISHVIKCGRTPSYHWLVNVKIVHYQLIVDANRVYSMKREWQEIVKNSLSSLITELMLEINWHIRLFDRVVLPFVNSAFYLQSVANRIDCTDEKRSLARSLLKQGHHFWLEDFDASNLKQRCHKSVPLRTYVTCIGVSSNEQLVAIGYKDGWISIFTVQDFQEIQTFNTMLECDVFRSDDVFSQENCMLLYDEYDRFFVPNTSQDLPFFGGDYGALWSCSFSLSGKRLVTCDGSEKIKLWDVNDGKLLAELQAGGPVDSCFFSECGLFIVASKGRKNDQSANQTDVFTVWNAVTQQRVDRRSINCLMISVDGFKICEILHSIYRLDMIRSLPNGDRKTQISMSRNGDYIDVFQLPDMLLAAKLYGHFFPFLTPVTRDHWRDCVMHHTNELMQFINVLQLGIMIAKGRCGKEFVRGGPLTYFIGCLCSLLKATRVAPVKFQELYIVPFFNKLNVFNIIDHPSLSIQSLPFPESYVISCCCFSPDGFFLATCANHSPLSILIWDTKLCTIVQVLRVPLVLKCAKGCWWSESLLWIYDGGLVKIPISNDGTLELTEAQKVQISWKATKMLTFSDVLIFLDQNNSVNVARIKAGELQYVEKLPIDSAVIQCAAVSPFNSVILTASSTTFYVFKDQSPQPPHWKALNTGKYPDVLDRNDCGGGNDQLLVPGKVGCKCAITIDGKRGVFALSFDSRSYLILVDLNSQGTTCIRSSVEIATMDFFFVGNLYCIAVNILGGAVVVEELSGGKVVTEWSKSFDFDFSPIVALSKNDLVAIISANGPRVQFLKIIVPDKFAVSADI